MRSKNICGAIYFLFFICFAETATAQQGSLYFSVGQNNTWFGKSTIHVDQPELGNNYDLKNVKANNKAIAPFSALQLNYHLGYYCDDAQNIGLELSFDPLNYSVNDNQLLTVKGTVNNMFNVNKSVMFSKATGAYYYYDGAHAFLVSFVRRFGIYRANTNNIGFDVLTKAGFGPVLPSFHNSLPIFPVNDPGMQWGGWNAAAEAAIRVSVYRRFYVEVAGKYGYAALDNLKIYDGKSSQQFSYYEIMWSAGVTLPTNRMNPLFRHERKIITILPFFINKDNLGEEVNVKEAKEDIDGADTAGVRGVQDIPEFDDIVNKNRRGEDTVGLDSLARRDSLARVAEKDAKHKKKKRFRREEDQHITVDSLGNVIAQDSLWNKENPEHLSKKELKKKKKAEEKAKKEQELKQQQAPIDSPAKAPEITDPGNNDQPPKPKEEVKPEQPKTPEVKPEDQKPQEAKPEEPKKEEVKTEEPKEQELSKKEKKRKAKEERKAQKEKEKEKEKEQQDQKDKEAQDNKDKQGGQ